MKNIALLVTTGLTSILLFDNQAQAQKRKPYGDEPVSFVSFVPSQWTTDNPYPVRKGHSGRSPEIQRHIMNDDGQAVLENQETTAYIVPGPQHKLVGSPQNLQDYIVRKFSWNMVFK